MTDVSIDMIFRILNIGKIQMSSGDQKRCSRSQYVLFYVMIMVKMTLLLQIFGPLFRPERFLEMFEGGWRLVKKDQFVPFGFGRRVCMGESLARDNLLIFLTTLLKHIRLVKKS